MKKYPVPVYNCKSGQLETVYKSLNEMSRCYENVNYITGEIRNYNRCGHALRVDNNFYCPNNGNQMKICGYAGKCGCVVEPELLKEKQLSFF